MLSVRKFLLDKCLDVAIVGKSNVGKSTLFNRLVNRKHAIVYQKGGTTRDRRISNIFQYHHFQIRLTDTPGLEFLTEANILTQMRKQVDTSLRATDLVFFVVDNEINLVDVKAAQYVKEFKKKTILIQNKIERNEGEFIQDCYELELGDPVQVSAKHNYRINDIYDRVCLEMDNFGNREEGEEPEEELEEEPEEEPEEELDEELEIPQYETSQEEEFEAYRKAPSRNEEMNPILENYFSVLRERERFREIPTFSKSADEELSPYEKEIYRLMQKEKEDEVFPSALKKHTSQLKSKQARDYSGEFSRELILKKTINVAFLGVPNTGKSSLVNSLLEEDRLVVDSQPHSTTDSISSPYFFRNRKMYLVDTAGLLKNFRKDEFSDPARNAIWSLRRAHVCCLVVDASQYEASEQIPTVWEFRLAKRAVEEGKAVLVCINKWDRVEENEKEDLRLRILEHIRKNLWQCKNIPVVFCSATRQLNLTLLTNKILLLYRRWNARVPTSKLNSWLQAFMKRFPAPWKHGQKHQIKYMTQVRSRPPTFVLHTNTYGKMAPNYLMQMQNTLREEFGMHGTPLRMLIRSTLLPPEHKKLTKRQLLKWRRLSPQAAEKAGQIYEKNKKRHIRRQTE